MADRHRRTGRRASSSSYSSRVPIFEQLEPRLLLSGNLNGMHLADQSVDRFDDQVIYLDFDGEQGVSYDNDALGVYVSDVDMGALALQGELSGQEQKVIDSVLSELASDWADTGVRFTLNTAVNRELYGQGSTIYIGDDNGAFDQLGGDFLGLAETIDIGNQNNIDEAFVFSSKFGSFDSTITAASTIANTIEHEAGHLMGMQHVEAIDGVRIENYALTGTVAAASSGSVYRNENGTYGVHSSSTLIAGQNDVAFNPNDTFVRGYAVFDLRTFSTDADISKIRLRYDLDIDSGNDPDGTIFWVEMGPLSISKSTWDSASNQSRWKWNPTTFYETAYMESLSTWNDDDNDTYVTLPSTAHSKVESRAGDYVVFHFRLTTQRNGTTWSGDQYHTSNQVPDLARLTNGWDIYDLTDSFLDDDWLATFSDVKLEITYSLPVPDHTRPTATLLTVTPPTGGGTLYFEVRYADNVAVDNSDINDFDIKVTGPNGYLASGNLRAISTSSDTSPITATYRITAPGGGWGQEDDGTYTISMNSNQVSDTNNNYVLSGSLGTFEVDLSDHTRPTATLLTVTPPTGGGTLDFQVRYADNEAVDASDINNFDIKVTGPYGYLASATAISTSTSSDTSPITATYRITAPGGSWGPEDRGTYTISMNSNQVSDTNNNYVLSGSLGTFGVDIHVPDTTRPTATLWPNQYPAPVAGGTTWDFLVSYNDNVAVDASDVGSSDITVTGPNGYSQNASFVSRSTNSDTSPITATYRVTAPGGSWGPEDAGTYTISMNSNQVSDTNNNYVLSGSLGTYVVDFPDTTAPTPNRSTWSIEPYARGTTSIKMYATSASDPSGVEYYFDETSGNAGGSDSGWQDSRSYEDTGLSPNTTYTYKVKTRDKSSNQNEGSYSGSRSATTDLIDDEKQLTHITISGSTAVNESSFANYTATAYYDDGSSQNITNLATWSDNRSLADIDSGGKLTTYSVPSDQTCVIRATYSGKSDTHDVTIKDIKPDLIGTIDVSPEPLHWGGSFNISAMVNNIGGAADGLSTARFYLSSDSTIDSSDYLLGTSDVSRLPAGGSMSIEQSSNKLPSLLPSGFTATDDVWIGMIVDVNDQVTETNEDNNTASDAVHIAAPDLVGMIYVLPEPLHWGGSFNITATVSNIGVAPAGPSTARFYLSSDSTIDSSDYLLGTSNVSGLPAGDVLLIERSSNRLPSNPPSGFTATDDMWVGMIVDVNGNVTETNENNNSAVSNLLADMEGEAAPNLVGTIDVLPEPLHWGDSFNISATVSNFGSDLAGLSTARFYLSSDSTIDSSDYLLGTSNVSSLSAGGSMLIERSSNRLPSSPPSGFTSPEDVWIGIIADDSDQVTETNESDNTAYDAVHIDQLGPDLVGTINANLLPQEWGGTAFISAMVSNIGIALAGPSVARFYLSSDSTIDSSDYLLGTSNVSSLLPGGSMSIERFNILPSSPPSGFTAIDDNWIGIIVDDGEQVTESNENNNTASDQLTGIGEAAPDLVGTINVMPELLQWGDSFNISATVSNIGVAPAGLSTARFYLSSDSTIDSSDYLLGTSNVSSLLPGGSMPIERSSNKLPSTLPSGFTATDDVWIGMIVDVNDQLTESNENNNTTSDAVHLDIPDLVGMIYMMSEPLHWGDSFNIAATVSNIGIALAGPSVARFYLSSDSTIDSSDYLLGTSNVSSLLAGESMLIMRSSNQLPFRLPSGFTATDDVWIGMIVDVNDQLTESNESNNTTNIWYISIQNICVCSFL